MLQNNPPAVYHRNINLNVSDHVTLRLILILIQRRQGKTILFHQNVPTLKVYQYGPHIDGK